MANTSLEYMNKIMEDVAKTMGVPMEQLAMENDKTFNSFVRQANILPKPKRNDVIVERIILRKNLITSISFTPRDYVRAVSLNGIVNQEIHTKRDPYITIRYRQDTNAKTDSEIIVYTVMKNSVTISLYNQLLAIIEDIIEMPIADFTDGHFNYE